MEYEARPIRYFDPLDANLGDHAWRAGTRTREDTEGSIRLELEAYEQRRKAAEALLSAC